MINTLEELLKLCDPREELDEKSLKFLQDVKDIITIKLEYVRERDKINEEFIKAMERHEKRFEKEGK